MPHQSAITRLKVILIIDLILVAFAAAGYYYVQSLPPPKKAAEYQVTNLSINPPEAGIGQLITISVNVTNVGERGGNYSASLVINGMPRENKTVQLFGGASQIIEFTVQEDIAGSYSLCLAGLNGTFTVSNLAPPPTLKIHDLAISPYEAWPGELVTISVKADNTGNEPISYWLPFKVNGVIIETKEVELAAGTIGKVEANVTENSEGTYNVYVGGLTAEYTIVPTGKHTLRIASAPGGASFTLDGVSHTTQYSELLNSGTHAIGFPERFEVPQPPNPNQKYQFISWADGYQEPMRTIDLQSYTLLVVNYLKLSSCPSLYVWNGNKYVYRAEVAAGTGYLGILDYFRADGTIAFAYSDPWDYIKLDRNQIQPRNGYYDMILTQRSDEIFYIDSAQLLVVDHPSNVDVYSTQSTYIYNLDPNSKGKIYTVSKNPLTPVSAINENGENCLPQISKLDGISTLGHEFQWDTLTLDLGDLSGAKEIKLIVAGTTIYSSGEVQGEWAARFSSQPGIKPFPPPYMEVKDAQGRWILVPESRQFPLVDVTSDCFVVDLTGLFPPGDYSLRIHSFFNTRFDYIGVDTTLQQTVMTQWINPYNADLHQAYLTDSNSKGLFTRYGDVTALMLEADDKSVIGRQGDEVSMKFLADLGPVPENMERDYFLFISAWFKVKGLPYLSFEVEPLPFHAMNCLPYPSTESYPYDEEHLAYLLEYNTRRA
jgi:hypothetical protein